MTFKRTFHAVETHSGEPMRVITGGVPHIPGNTVYEQMKWLEKNDDQIRMLMLREPRGYPPLCCNLVVPAKHPDAAAGYIIMEQVEYPVMSGGNTILVATVLLETGMIPMQEPVTTAPSSRIAGVSSRPDWAMASFAATTANCAKRSMRLMSLEGMWSSGTKPWTSAACLKRSWSKSADWMV